MFNGKKISGTYKYYVMEGGVKNEVTNKHLPVGDYKIYVEFTPTDIAHYTAQSITKDITVTPRALTVETNVVASKVYDETTVCAIDGEPVISGIVGISGSDKVFVDATAAYDDKNVGENKHVSVTYTWSGADLGNYTYPTSDDKTASITKAELAEGSNISTENTIYGAKIDGSESGDIKIAILDKDGNDITDKGSIVYYYKDKFNNIKPLDKGEVLTPGKYNIWAEFTSDDKNYQDYTTQEYEVEIGKKKLVATTEIENEKLWDGNTSAKVISSDISGIIGYDADALNIKVSANYDNSNLGTEKTITISYDLGNSKVASYYIAPDSETREGTINGQLPVIALTPDNVVYGAETSVVGSNITASVTYGDEVVDGTIEYYIGDEKVNDKVLDPGKHDIIVRFQPSNTNRFLATSATTTINVEKAALSVEHKIAGTKVYDKSTDAEVSVSGIYGIQNDDDVSMTASAEYSDINTGNGKEVTVTYSWGGDDIWKYTYPTAAADKADITPKQLYANAEVKEWKYYDGNTDCEIVSVSELEGVIEGDDVKLKSASATYSNAEKGENKAVTVVYTIEGNDAANYIVPEPSMQTADILFEDLIFAGLHTDKPNYCKGDVMSISFKITKGTAQFYRLEFHDGEEFDNTEWEPLAENTETITFAIPHYTRAGNYRLTLSLMNNSGAVAKQSTSFTLNIPEKYVVAKFHDVVLVDNHEDQFVEYLWYKNNIEQTKQTAQYWQDKSGRNEGLDGWYMARVVTVSNDTLMTCPVYYSNLQVSNHFSVIVYPNPARAYEDINIQLKDITQEQLAKAEIHIYTNGGKLTQKLENIDIDNHTQLSTGEYVGKVIVGKETRSFKIIVK